MDERYFRQPPPNGLIVNVHARALEKTAAGRQADADCRVGGGDEASRDHLWLAESEWRSFIPGGARPGLTFPMAPAITERIARFHLINNTRGEPPMWRRDEVRRWSFSSLWKSRPGTAPSALDWQVAFGDLRE